MQIGITTDQSAERHKQRPRTEWLSRPRALRVAGCTALLCFLVLLPQFVTICLMLWYYSVAAAYHTLAVTVTASLHTWAVVWLVLSLPLGWLTTYGKALEDISVATAACGLVSGMHAQGMAGLSSGRSPAAWNVFLAATKAAVHWSTVYGRSIMGAYVPGGFQRDMQGISWSEEPSFCQVLSSRAHQYDWLLEGHTISPSASGLGGLILAAACMMWIWTLWLQVSSTQKQMASEIQRLRNMQDKSQPDASGQGSKRAGGSILLNRTISGTSNAGSGIPADYGAASGNPTPNSPPLTPTVSNDMVSTETQTPLNTGDGATPAVRSSGDHIGVAGDALNPNTQEVFIDDASTHVEEDVAVPSTQSQESTPGPSTQSQENTPVPTTTTNTTTTTTPQTPTDAQANPITPTPNTEVALGERPEEIIEEIIPVSNVHVEKNRLTVVIQQLLKMVETAANPTQGTHFHLISLDVNVSQCLLPSDRGAELAAMSIDAFLISVDVFQQEGKFTAAIALMAKVVGVAHWASLPAGKQSELYGRRALVFSAANQAAASFADWLHATQLSPSSSAAEEVVNQLGHWGNYASMRLFYQSIQALVRGGGAACSEGLQARVKFWLSARASLAQVLSKPPTPKESGKAFLEEITPLVQSFPQNQALLCLHARQLMHLGKFQEALLAVAPCLGCGNDLAPSRWALHLTVHAHWLTGGLDQMVMAVRKLLRTECSPLEGSVEYTVPDSTVLAALLTQLEGLQGRWVQVDRCESVDSAEGLLKQVEASCRGLMSPLLRSRQLLLWAHLHYARACCALNMGQPAVQDVVKALVACERARALSPSCWRKAVPMQAYLLSMLGSGGALYELYSDVLTEPDITAEECVDYNALRAAADTLPGLCELCDAAHKPPLNPAQLLGVTFNATPEQVNSARNKLTMLCHPDKACLPGNSFVGELKGVGALMGDAAPEAMQRLQGATITVSLVNAACYTMTNRFLKAHAEAWYNLKYSSDSLTGIPVPLAFHAMVIPVTEQNLWAVREIRQQIGGLSEHQDLAPDVRDVERGVEQYAEGDWNPGTGEPYQGEFWSSNDNDLPQYEDA